MSGSTQSEPTEPASPSAEMPPPPDKVSEGADWQTRGAGDEGITQQDGEEELQRGSRPD
jgi:hypothetical protein